MRKISVPININEITDDNAQSQRFLVLGYDAYIHNLNKNYFNNYYRQEQIAQNVEWLCGI